MSRVERLYSWLAEGPAPNCDQILGEALERAEPPYFARLERILITRGSDASWGALVGSYAQLSAAARASLHAAPDRLRAGIVGALRCGSTTARRNALEAFEAEPIPELAYTLPDALRSSSLDVREAAARAIRKLAEIYADAGDRQCSDPDQSAAWTQQRRVVVDMLREALRTFGLHHRADVLEVCLWFARELGPALWATLSTARSPCGRLLTERLESWNSPRLAGFLLEALTRAEWRRPAARLLRTWSSLAEVTAVLRLGDRLNDAAFCRSLVLVRRPAWFTRVGVELRDLPPELRAQAPQWMCYIGFGDHERLGYLSDWIGAEDAVLHEAAVRALANLGTPGAVARLEEVAASSSSLAAFAQMCVTGHRAARAGRGADGLPHDPIAAVPTYLRDGAALEDEFTTLWQMCRRTDPREARELIALLREHPDKWRWRLVAYLRSPDPRDRLLVLRVLNTEELIRDFRPELEPLRDDQVESVRLLAETLLDTVSVSGGQAGEVSDGRGAPGAPRQTTPTAPAADGPKSEVRRELRAALAQLAEVEDELVESGALVARVEQLLQKLRAGSGDGASDPARENEVRP